MVLLKGKRTHRLGTIMRHFITTYFYYTFFSFILIFQFSCGGAGVGGLATDDGLEINNERQPSILDETDKGSEKIMPPVSVPAPSIDPSNHAKFVIAYACDSNSECPVSGIASERGQTMAVVQDPNVLAQIREQNQTRLAQYQNQFKFSYLEKNLKLSKITDINFNNISAIKLLSAKTKLENKLHQTKIPLNLNHKLTLLSKSAWAFNIDARNSEFQVINDPNHVDDICDRNNVTCCPVDEETGEFTCYPLGTNDSEFAYFLTKNGMIHGEVSFTQANENMLFFSETLNQITPALNHSDDLGPNNDSHSSLALSGASIKKFISFYDHDEEKLVHRVLGDSDNNYRAYNAMRASHIHFNKENNSLSLLHKESGIEFRDYFDLNNEGFLKTVDFMNHYHKLKRTSDNKLRFLARTGNESDHYVSIYSADDNVDNHDDDPDFDESIVALNLRDQNDVRACKNALAYDVDREGCSLFAYESVDNNVRLKLACLYSDDYKSFGGNLPLRGLDENSYLTDIHMYDTEFRHENAMISGQALLLDEGSGKIWHLRYQAAHNFDPNRNDPVQGSYLNSVIRDGILVQELSDFIEIGVAPVAMILNTDRSLAYVLHRDDKLSVLRLKSEAGSYLNNVDFIKQTKNTYDLKSFLNLPARRELARYNKKMSPKNIELRELPDGTKFLMISLNGLKAGLMIDSNQIRAKSSKEIFIEAKEDKTQENKTTPSLMGKHFIDTNTENTDIGET